MTPFFYLLLSKFYITIVSVVFYTTLKKNNKVKLGDIFVSKSENNKRKQKIFVQTKHALISYFLLTLYFLFLLSLKVLYTFAKYLKILKRRFLY
jgi:hypothetical protein